MKTNNLPTGGKNSSCILVYRTNITTELQAAAVCYALESSGTAAQCSVDLDDCDKVLRVFPMENQHIIVEKVRAFGVDIEEL